MKLKCTVSGHYYITISLWLLLKCGMVKDVPFANEIASKSIQKIATKLYKQFSH